MPSFIRAIAKALGKLAGPAGFPAEFAISIYDDERAEQRNAELMRRIIEGHDLTREIIAQIVESKEGYSAIHSQLVCGLQIALRLLAENRQVLQSLLPKDPKNADLEVMADAIVPLMGEHAQHFAAEGFLTEQAMIDELMHLYPDTECFFPVVYPAGFPEGVITHRTPPVAAYLAFVQTVRGLDNRCKVTLFRALHRNKPASKVLQTAASLYEEMLAGQAPTASPCQLKGQAKLDAVSAASIANYGTATQEHPSDVAEAEAGQKMHRDQMFTLRDDLNLQSRQVASVLVLSLELGDRWHVCVHPAATHCAGAAAAGLAMRILLAHMGHLQNGLNARSFELCSEKDFTELKLEEHLHSIGKLGSTLSLLLDGDVRPSRGIGNLMAKTVRQLPHGEAVFKGGLGRIRGSLDGCLERMRNLHKSISENRVKDWGQDIEAVLKDVAAELQGLCDKLEHVRERTRHMIQLARIDWERCTDQLETTVICVPRVNSSPAGKRVN